jgi:hypothetical protein
VPEASATHRDLSFLGVTPVLPEVSEYLILCLTSETMTSSPNSDPPTPTHKERIGDVSGGRAARNTSFSSINMDQREEKKPE